MKRAELLRQIRNFQPEVSDIGLKEPFRDFSKLDPLVEELFEKRPHEGLDALFRVFERFPNEHNDWFWSYLHGIEGLLGYERKLLASFRRSPAEHTGLMLLRLVDGDQTHIGRTDVLELVLAADAPEPLKTTLRELAEPARERLAERRKQPKLPPKEAFARLCEAAGGESQVWWDAIDAFYRSEPPLPMIFEVYRRFPDEEYHSWNRLNFRVERTRGYAKKAIAEFRAKPSTGTAFLVARLATAGDRSALAAIRKQKLRGKIKRTIEERLFC